MAGNRAAAEASILKDLNDIIPGTENIELYKKFFATLSDEEFDAFIKKLENEETYLTMQIPNMGKEKISLQNNLDVAKKWGHQFYERIWMDEGNDIPPYLTNYRYLVMDLPLRRQAQLLTKKISIPANNINIDNLTGQPTNQSKGSKISYPELQILAALGLEKSTLELIKYRGGDLKGFNMMNSQISKTGGVNTDMLDKLGTRVRSTSVLSTYLKAMHINNNA